MELHSYREQVLECAKTRDGSPIYNRSIEHAAIVVEQLFANANSNVNLLTGKLEARVYGGEQVREQAALFLAHPSRNLRILIEDKDAVTMQHPFFKQFQSLDNVQVCPVHDHLQKLYKFHFMVTDNNCYRFESDKGDSAAVASFGAEAVATNLRGVFDSIWNAVKTVDPADSDPGR